MNDGFTRQEMQDERHCRQSSPDKRGKFRAFRFIDITEDDEHRNPCKAQKDVVSTDSGLQFPVFIKEYSQDGKRTGEKQQCEHRPNGEWFNVALLQKEVVHGDVAHTKFVSLKQSYGTNEADDRSDER